MIINRFQKWCNDLFIFQHFLLGFYFHSKFGDNFLLRDTAQKSDISSARRKINQLWEGRSHLMQIKNHKSWSTRVRKIFSIFFSMWKFSSSRFCSSELKIIIKRRFHKSIKQLNQLWLSIVTPPVVVAQQEERKIIIRILQSWFRYENKLGSNMWDRKENWKLKILFDG